MIPASDKEPLYLRCIQLQRLKAATVQLAWLHGSLHAPAFVAKPLGVSCRSLLADATHLASLGPPLSLCSDLQRRALHPR